MGSLPNPEEPCVTLDQVIRRRADTHADRVLISYPTNETDFVDYTGADLEQLTRLAATKYAQSFKKLDQETALSGASSTVAMVGISSLEYYITFLALQRLGLNSMFISPRLADQGFAHLLKSIQCKFVVASSAAQESMERVRNSFGLPLAVVPMLDKAFLTDPISLEQAQSTLPPIDDGNLQGFIIHSGGTTGLPKPVPLRSKAWLLQAANIAGRMPKVDTLSTLPLFHSFGLATLLRCLVNGKRLSILNANRPITASIILSSLDITSSQALVTVPYILKFFTETPTGTQRLASLAQVIAAGSAIPDDLGDALVAAGTNIFHLYGQTESGALMEPSADQWNWVTPLPDAAPFLAFEPVAENLFHLVVLPGLKAKVFSDRPDGAYATKDLFQRHPADPRKWKFVARQDDLVVLVNGEKADPIPLEEAVGRNANVRAAVVFGAQRDALGMVVVAADGAAGLSAQQVLASIQPDLELGNSRVPAYARIPPDGVIVKAAGTPFPCTDKATVIRSLFIKQFAADIENYYAARDAARDARVLSDAEVRDLVRQTVRRELRVEEDADALADESDFFVLGMDSLQATNVRSRLLREVNLGGKSLATNVVFDHPSVGLLTNHLLDVRGGVSNGQDSTEQLALELLEKYSDFPPAVPGTITAEHESVVSPLPPTSPPKHSPSHSSSPAPPAPSAATSSPPSSRPPPSAPSTASSAPPPPPPPTRASPPPSRTPASSRTCPPPTSPKSSPTSATSPRPSSASPPTPTPTSPAQPPASSTTPGPSTSTTPCAPSRPPPSTPRTRCSRSPPPRRCAPARPSRSSRASRRRCARRRGPPCRRRWCRGPPSRRWGTRRASGSGSSCARARPSGAAWRRGLCASGRCAGIGRTGCGMHRRRCRRRCGRR